MRLFRLFELMDCFRARIAPVRACELADLTGVSVRSIYRDIADLQAMGAPIRGEGGIGYVLERGYFMPPLRFEPDEIDAVALGMRLVAERASGSLAAAAMRAAAKIASSVGDTAREQLLSAPLEAGPSTAKHRCGHGCTLDDLRHAIRRRRVLEIRYLSLSERRSTRRARPLGLTIFDANWLLTVWCESAEDFRHLRIDRIESVRDSGTVFHSETGKRFSDAVVLERAKIEGSVGQMAYGARAGRMGAARAASLLTSASSPSSQPHPAPRR
jgi:predicted DNA-binding transcriptional regulator YafY